MSLLFSTGAIAGSAAKGAPGMVLMKPTSIANSGGSATLGANGQVTFSAVNSVSLNGCFTADFDNYVISFRSVLSSGDEVVFTRLRASGSDATGSDYTYQVLSASDTSVTASRGTTTGTWGSPTSATLRSGNDMYLYGPALAQPTAMRVVSVWGYLNALIQDAASTHSLSTAYDGITFYRSPQTFTGALQVYGIRS